MKQVRWIIRAVALILAALLMVSTLVSGLSLLVSAAYYPDVRSVRTTDGGTVTRIRYGNTYVIRFRYTTSEAPSSTRNTYRKTGLTLNSAWRGTNASLEIVLTRSSTDGNTDEYIVDGTLTAQYVSHSDNPELTIESVELTMDSDHSYTIDTLYLEIPDSYFNSSTSTGDDGVDVTEETLTSQVMVENMVALDSAGNRIDEITKDSPPFTLEVVFADVGLRDVDLSDIKNGDMQAYITGAGGFTLGSTAKGTITLASQNVDYPRFRARFSNVTYTGAEKSLTFTVFYNIDGFTTLKGEGSATLFSAKVDSEDEDEESTAGIKVPKIIISQYTYGEEAIVAGSEFTLAFTLRNTSTELPLENIVVTLTPSAPAGTDSGPGLIVASSSNTIYVDSLPPGATQNYAVDFMARPDASVTSHLIDVKFSYEYIKSEKEGYTAAPELAESIAIPVNQIDRFSIDPILEEPYGTVGEELYLTVNIINKGKSPTYNISGTVKVDPSVTAPAQHFGNLEAGAAESMDFYLTGTQPGSFEGEIIIQYEDNNNNVKEVAVPFSMTVEERYVPQPDSDMMDPDMMEPPPQGPNLLTVIFCVIGGLAIATPIALYLMKRVRAKGSEEFDETL